MKVDVGEATRLTLADAAFLFPGGDERAATGHHRTSSERLLSLVLSMTNLLCLNFHGTVEL
jgi:hypothetical protein